MFVEDGLNFIISSHNACISLVRNQVKLYFFPDSVHFCQHGFDVKLFGSLLPNLHASITMFKQTNFENFIECEFWIRGVNVLSDEFRNFCPVSFFHTVFPESDHEGQFWFELFHVVFDSLTDGSDVGHGLVLEVLVGVDDVPEAFLNKLFSSVGINGLELVVHPHCDICVPPVNNGPESKVRRKLFCDLL